MFHCRHSCADDSGQLDDGAVCWPAAQSGCTGAQLCARHRSAERSDIPPSPVEEERDHGCTRYPDYYCYGGVVAEWIACLKDVGSNPLKSGTA